MSRFINAELKSDSESESEPDSEAESESDTELMAKLKSDSDSESILIFVDFGQVILLLIAGHIKPVLFMPIFLRERFFSQALFQTYFLLGSKIHKHFSYFNTYLHC